MFKEERRSSRGASFVLLPRPLPLVSLFLLVFTATLATQLAAEEDMPPDPGSGGVIATDLEEPAEFIPKEEQVLELKLPLPAEGDLEVDGEQPAGDVVPGQRRGASSLAQPHSVAGAVMPADEQGVSTGGRPGIFRSAEQDATPEEIAEAQEHIQSAHALAKSAASTQEYSAIIELCKQGEKSTRWLAGRGYFRRLAAWAHNRRGEERVKNGQDADALEDFHQAVKLDPRNWRAAHNRGVSYAQLGDLEAAVRDLAHAIRIKPDHGAAYRNRGEVFFEQERYAEAIEDYTRALAHMPDRDELYYLRADAHYRLGNLQEALADYDASLQAGDQPRRLVGRSGVHAALGNHDAAIKDLDQAIRLDAQNSEAYRAVAWILATCPDPRYRRPDKALVAARHALKLQGNSNPHYFDTLAAAYASAQSFDQAASIQQHAVSLAVGTEEQELLATRLALYRQHRPYVSGTRGTDRTATKPRPTAPPSAQQSAPPAAPRSRAAGPAGIRQPRGHMPAALK